MEKKSCVDCGSLCCGEQTGSYPDFCLTTGADSEDLEEVRRLYCEDGPVRQLAMAAAEVEGAFYCKYTRVEEIMEFARRLGVKRIGLAFCGAVMAEARTFAKILRVHGFEVVACQCKAGALPKEELDIPEQYIKRPEERACNPVLQAKVLNRAQTGLNVTLGLCVGHDSLFYRFSQAPVTTLFAKDRVMGHSPAAPLYLTHSFYRRLLEPEK